nr:selenocysteine lyase isoform X8 [Equus asinus]
MEAVAAPNRDVRVRAASPPGGRGEKSQPESRQVYMDCNATTPLEPEVIQAVTEAMREAWGNPSSAYPAGRKAKDIINAARENLAKMIGGKPQDIIFTSGGTESNNLVIHSVVKHFHEIHTSKGGAAESHSPAEGAMPHFITCTVEHDSIRLPLEHLAKEHVAAVTFVPVSKVNGQAEVDDILAAVRPTTCLVTIMLANNETGVIMPVPEISQRVRALNQRRATAGLPLILLHTDAAQALGKRRVDVEDLGVDFLTIVGHKFYGPRIGALYVRGLSELTPLYPMLFGGGQERNFRPGWEASDETSAERNSVGDEFSDARLVWQWDQGGRLWDGEHPDDCRPREVYQDLPLVHSHGHRLQTRSSPSFVWTCHGVLRSAHSIQDDH